MVQLTDKEQILIRVVSSLKLFARQDNSQIKLSILNFLLIGCRLIEPTRLKNNKQLPLQKFSSCFVEMKTHQDSSHL